MPKFADKRILLCWHHGNIPALMHELDAPGGSYPNPWDSQVFNVILQVKYSSFDSTVARIVEPF